MSFMNAIGMPLLHLFDAEFAHGMVIRALETGLVQISVPKDDPALSVELFDMNFPNPVGLAAGFDKNGQVPDAILKLGFGFTEVGTVTPKAQAGNRTPRIFRLMSERAVINRLGFNNQGHAAMLQRLKQRRQNGIVGVNIGANRDSADKVCDYVLGVEAFKDFASYLAVNVSSPNTPGLRGLQERAVLENLLARISEVGCKIPVLLKIAPDLDDDAIQDIANVVLKSTVAGVIISNTTLSRPPLKSPEKSESGGLSGAPLFKLSTSILAKFYLATEGKIPLIGVGGIMCGANAWEKFRAGASLVQIYSGLVYEGPGLAAKINRYLIDRLRREGLGHINEVTGTGAKQWAKL